MLHPSDKKLKPIGNDIVNKSISAHLNINFIRNKFELLEDEVKSNIKILFISGKKQTNVTLSYSQFSIEGFSTLYRLDRYSNDGGILYYVPT